MKKVLLTIFFCISCVHLGYAAQPGAEENQLVIELHECKDSALGVQFLCNPGWALETDTGVILIVISADPAVTMTVAKEPAQVLFIEQLTDPILREMGQYMEEWFKKSNASIGQEQAWQIEGYANGYPEIRLLDYYLIHDKNLYSILFSVNPQSRWYDYEELFHKIRNSIKFLE